MDPREERALLETRRQFFGRMARGLGPIALASLLNPGLGRAAVPEHQPGAAGVLGQLHHPPKAKRVIYMIMNGAPSQLDLFDYKPKMQEMFDADLPESVRMGQRLTTMTSGQSRFPVAPSIYKFAQYGQAGAWISELLPHLATVVDEIAIVKSMYTEAINHDPAITYLLTGAQVPGRPSLGAWLSYGLGSMNADLPTFVVLHSTWSAKRDAQAIYERLWGPGFLPSQHQGVSFRSQGDPVLYLTNPPGVSPESRRKTVDLISKRRLVFLINNANRYFVSPLQSFFQRGIKVGGIIIFLGNIIYSIAVPFMGIHRIKRHTGLEYIYQTKTVMPHTFLNKHAQVLTIS